MQNPLFLLPPLVKKIARLYIVAIGIAAVGMIAYNTFRIRSSGPFHAYTEGIEHSRFVRNKVGEIRKMTFFLNQVEYPDSIYYMASVIGSKQQLNVLGKVAHIKGNWRLVSLEENKGQFERLIRIRNRR